MRELLPSLSIICSVSPPSRRRGDAQQRRPPSPSRCGHAGGHQAVEEVDLDVVVLRHADRRAGEDGGDQQVARDLLGPGRRVVEQVARPELGTARPPRAARRSRRDPRLGRRARQVRASSSAWNSPSAPARGHLLEGAHRAAACGGLEGLDAVPVLLLEAHRRRSRSPSAPSAGSRRDRRRRC